MNLAKKLIYIGILLQGLGFSGLLSPFIPDEALTFSASVFLMFGIMRFAQACSRSWAWGLLGYIPFFGLLILAFLQDSKTGRYPIADNDGLNLSDDSCAEFSIAWFNWAWIPVLWLVCILDCASISLLLDHMNQKNLTLALILLPITYISNVILFNKTTIHINSERIDIGYSPLPWKKSLSISADQLVGVSYQGGEMNRPMTRPENNDPMRSMWGNIFKKILLRHHVWIHTKSGDFKIISFCREDNAIAVVDKIKTAMSIVDIEAIEASDPPKSGSWV